MYAVGAHLEKKASEGLRLVRLSAQTQLRRLGGTSSKHHFQPEPLSRYPSASHYPVYCFAIFRSTAFHDDRPFESRRAFEACLFR